MKSTVGRGLHQFIKLLTDNKSKKEVQSNEVSNLKNTTKLGTVQ